MIAITSYLLIILRGDMIAVPFFFWLLFTLFGFDNSDQIFAFLSIIGLTVSSIKRNSGRILKAILSEVVCFGLLISPIIKRLASVPIEKFNYLGFIIPTIIFTVFYIISVYLSAKQHLQAQETAA